MHVYRQTCTLTACYVLAAQAVCGDRPVFMKVSKTYHDLRTAYLMVVKITHIRIRSLGEGTFSFFLLFYSFEAPNMLYFKCSKHRKQGIYLTRHLGAGRSINRDQHIYSP